MDRIFDDGRILCVVLRIERHRRQVWVLSYPNPGDDIRSDPLSRSWRLKTVLRIRTLRDIDTCVRGLDAAVLAFQQMLYPLRVRLWMTGDVPSICIRWRHDTARGSIGT